MTLKVYDMRTGMVTHAAPSRDWKQVAKAARGVLAKDDARARIVRDVARGLWSLSRQLRRGRHA